MDKRSQQGDGASEIIIVMAFAIYFLFMGYLARGLGLEAPGLLAFVNSRIPSFSGSSGGILGTLDTIANVLVAIANLLWWIVGSLISYLGMLSFSISGGMPLWVTAIVVTIPVLGVGWLIMMMIRGRE